MNLEHGWVCHCFVVGIIFIFFLFSHSRFIIMPLNKSRTLNQMQLNMFVELDTAYQYDEDLITYTYDVQKKHTNLGWHSLLTMMYR